MQDEIYMARAMKLAQRGRFTTHPNPNVGCAIVKDGEILVLRPTINVQNHPFSAVRDCLFNILAGTHHICLSRNRIPVGATRCHFPHFYRLALGPGIPEGEAAWAQH